MALFSGFTSVSTVPAGSLAKASLVGAKTVKGPGELSVSTRPAALTAATRVVWIGELTAFSTMVLVGIHGCAADHGVLHVHLGDALRVVIARAAAATDARNVFFMVFPFDLRRKFMYLLERSLSST